MNNTRYLIFTFLTAVFTFSMAQQPKPKGKEARVQKRVERKQAKTTQNGLTEGSDKKAEKILDAVSKKYKANKTFQAKFTYTIENKADNIKESQNGTITTSGNSFRVEIAGQDIYSDGKIIYTYNKEVNEVSINNYSPKDADINPSEIFTMYQKGFLYRLVDEKTEGGRVVQNLELTPKDKKKTFFKVKVTVDKAAGQIIRSVIYDKNGNIYTYNVTKQTANLTLDKNYFVFDKKKYPGVQVVDLR